MNLLTQKNIRAAIAYFASIHHRQELRECTPPFQERVAVAALEKVLGEKKGGK